MRGGRGDWTVPSAQWTIGGRPQTMNGDSMPCDTEKNNLFVALHKWASKQDENFFTDAFAYLLRYLCSESPDIAVRILSRLTNCRLHVTGDNVKSAEIITQETSDYDWKRPDVRIRAGNQLVYVEVKSNRTPTGNSWKTIGRGLTENGKRKVACKRRWYCLRRTARVCPAMKKSWWTTNVVGLILRSGSETRLGLAGQELPEVGRFLIEQFVGFLKAERLYDGESDVRHSCRELESFMNLLKMIEEAISNRRDSEKR